MNERRMAALALLLAVLAVSGCAAVALGTAGGLLTDEGLIENDGRFDPLENTILRDFYN